MVEGNGNQWEGIFDQVARRARPRMSPGAQNLSNANPDKVRRNAEGLAKIDRVFEIHKALRSAAEKLKTKIDAAEAGGGDADLEELVPDEKGKVDLSFLATNPETGLVGISDSKYISEAEDRQTGKKKEIRDIDEVDDKVKGEILGSANKEYDEMVAKDAKFEQKARGISPLTRMGAWENRKKLETIRQADKAAESKEQFIDIVELGSFQELDEQLNRKGLRLVLRHEGNVWKFEAQGTEEKQQQFDMAALFAQVELAPKTSFTPEEVQDEIQKALDARDAERQAEANTAELTRLKAADVELKDLKARLPGMLEAAAEKAVDRFRAQEDRVHAAIIALSPNLPPAVLDALKRPVVNGDASGTRHEA